MQAVSKREMLLERRQHDQIQARLWEQLTLAQKFAASSLTQFGYDLTFIRSSGNGSLAILLCDGKIATIAWDGEIDTDPEIHIRN
ncbi:hypothetical protein DXX93_19935 [Thalassotalea euphylliae]|uniref:Uncharacterized protein n=1 Tax=Thalassotalea euphylliae TaxID=1655234 RepID=A0A3E0TVB9_9GAMM|nr:hypothetical protein [Thalassotalea euphylliae]REL28611.1 hypothetical protein DXX93_19935 [Thalassotalea euphylliae]